jgi:hypothetical protein
MGERKKMIKEKLTEICFNYGVGSPEDLDRTEGDWVQFSYNLDNLKDKRYVVISPINSSKVEYEIRGENDLKDVENLIKIFETQYRDEEDEEGVEVFDVLENKFLIYEINMEEIIRIEW